VKDGCLKNLFATIGCFTVLVLLVLGAVRYREQLAGVYRSIAGIESRPDPAESTVGTPSPEALRSAVRKEEQMASPRGPGYVHLSADEAASIIADRLAPSVRETLDSIRLTLSEDRVTFEAYILMDVFSRDLLGPLSEFLGSHQPMRTGGGVELHAPGLVAWRLDEFVLHQFPFPPSAIPRLVDRLVGGEGGAFLIAVPATVGEVRVRADGLTFYRRVQ
jgi:hypothetical protein